MGKDVVRKVQHTVPEEDGTVNMEIGTDEKSYIDKGKAVVVYNPFDALLLTDDAFWNVRGLNRRDHQVAVKELVNEFRHRINSPTGSGRTLFGITAVKEIVAYGNVWIDCWLMMLGYDCGRIRIINVLTLGLLITPHLCSEEILISIRRKLKKHSLTLLDKAPGPDGYSSGFYKAAWPVIGEEIIKAILEFFTTGRLLKQVNTTILALIPKVRAPSTVSDFRPISCCNVLYKVITKIIVQRLRLVLDKLISPSQNAFVPGRSIGDNILLAQELFAGYNRQGLPMRCALKVDLRKAYDTVEWDFLSAVLQMFGFSGTFIGWVEECVTTPMFSVCINGNPHGFFKGSRGLRQGDPMSPFLFVLIMEVLQLMLLQLIDQNEGFSFHWRCKELGLFQLCFADDLLLFCKADVASVRVFRHGLAEFAKLSGLHANPQKSQLILSRSAHDVREQLLAALHFQEGHLPLSRIKGWESIQLSFAGRLQLIKSVLMSLNLLGNGLHFTERGHQRGGKKMRTFLWKGNSAVGYPKVAWSVVCKPIEEGGQGIRDILALNKALMSRHLWNVIQNNQSSIWVKWIAHTRLHKSVWTVDVKGGSWGWRKILRLRSALLPYIEFKIGDGESFSLWHDPWHSLGSLITRFPRGPGRTSIPEAAKLSRDSILWRGGGFSTKAVYDIFRNHGPKCIRILKGTVRFTWPNRAWAVDIAWASKRWNGRHIVQAAYRALLAAIAIIFGRNVIEEFFSRVAAEPHYC
ncbi:UNVERIFIED_CONTAM: putative ribonuclease H protein [Sesamum angustifolium]|uniref:Ribonuclease H protein n=1 Tax=Sesamum angustifolium TaxID=2727405 RepID=A0AAW2JU83_9LAMI